MLQTWIAQQSQKDLRELVARLLGDDGSAVRVDILARIRGEMPVAAWPLAEPTRTILLAGKNGTFLLGS